MTHEFCLKIYNWQLNNMGLNYKGPLTMWSIINWNFFFQWIHTTVLHDPWLVEYEDAESRIWRAGCKVTCWFSTAWRVSTLNPCMVQGSTVHPKGLKAGIQTDISTPMFTAALFTMTKRWKQPMSISEWMDQTNCGVHAHSGILFSHEKEINVYIHYNVDGP